MDGMPMGRVYSVSDGTINNSSGVPYIMASPMDLSFQDVMVNVGKKISIPVFTILLHYVHFSENKKLFTCVKSCTV